MALRCLFFTTQEVLSVQVTAHLSFKRCQGHRSLQKHILAFVKTINKLMRENSIHEIIVEWLLYCVMVTLPPQDREAWCCSSWGSKSQTRLRDWTSTIKVIAEKKETSMWIAVTAAKQTGARIQLFHNIWQYNLYTTEWELTVSF